MSSALNAKQKISILGGGNWGSAVARRIGLNLNNRPNPLYDPFIRMWVYEEMVGNEKLTEVINSRHENVKYLPGVHFPINVRAVPDLLDTIRDANILLFVFPHQFLPATLKQLKGHIPKSTICVSLIKGIDVGPKGLRRYTEIIKEELGVENVAAVMGANVATDIAHDYFAETTVGAENLDVAKQVASLFQCDTLRTDVTDDISTVELCGALKNVVALGAGICDGMEMGCSTKAAVIRQGLEEMALFCRTFDSTGRYKPETILKSCGVADLIASSYGGRNRLCAKEFTTRCLRIALAQLSPHDKTCNPMDLLSSYRRALHGESVPIPADHNRPHSLPAAEKNKHSTHGTGNKGSGLHSPTPTPSSPMHASQYVAHPSGSSGSAQSPISPAPPAHSSQPLPIMTNYPFHHHGHQDTTMTTTTTGYDSPQGKGTVTNHTTTEVTTKSPQDHHETTTTVHMNITAPGSLTISQPSTEWKEDHPNHKNKKKEKEMHVTTPDDETPHRVHDGKVLVMMKPDIQELWQCIEAELLHGQKLQGVSTCLEVMQCLSQSHYLEEHPGEFPLFCHIYKIVTTGHGFHTMFRWE